jgi:hypothetical protein
MCLLRMNTSTLTAELRRQAAHSTMHRIEPSRAEEELRTFCGESGWSGWEENLLAQLCAPDNAPILAGNGDPGHRFIFSPRARAGFWTLARGNLRGKGQLLSTGITALNEIAREKGLLSLTPLA